MRKRLTFWRKLRLALVYFWRPAIFFALIGVLLYGLLWFRLDDLVPGMSPAEATAQRHLATGDITFAGIINNPLYLPYSLVLYVLQTLGLHGVTALRGVSALLGTISAISFFLIIRRWHTPRLAIFGSALFATSSWFLHTARYGSTDILYVSVLTVLLAGIWLQQTQHRRVMLVFVLLASSLYLYIPGMIWFVIITAIWQFKRLKREITRVRGWFQALLGIGWVVLVFPLVWSIFKDPNLIKAVMGLPNVWPSLGDLLQNIINIPLHLFVRGPNDPAKWLPGTAYLDIFSTIMMIVGIYWSIHKFKLDRVRATFGVILIGAVLIASGGLVSPALMMPFVYIIITSGMAFMLQQWFTVFPRNPIARIIGASLLSIAVLFTVFYHINHYFIAWPHTPAVRRTFTEKPIILN